MALLDAAFAGVARAATSLGQVDWAQPTRAAAWTVLALLHHQLTDAQRALVALACTTDAAPDVDRVTYWADFLPGAGAGPASLAAAAYDNPADLVARWTATAALVVRTATAADHEGRVETQGHVIGVGDLVSTLVVEATVHHLDLGSTWTTRARRRLPGAHPHRAGGHPRRAVARDRDRHRGGAASHRPRVPRRCGPRSAGRPGRAAAVARVTRAPGAGPARAGPRNSHDKLELPRPTGEVAARRREPGQGKCPLVRGRIP